MQFQVPQFIETEDKIVGPFTIRQFIYIAAAFGLSAILYFMVATWLWAILSVPLWALGAALAFVKINGQPFSRIIFAALTFYWQPQKYVWQPENPDLPKNESTLRPIVGNKFSLGSIIEGLALKRVWQQAQTGTKESSEKNRRGLDRTKEKYEIVHRLTGERKAVRRIDYR